MALDLGSHKVEVERQIDAYVYSLHEGAIGNAWPEAKVTEKLTRMRAALVEPYPIDVRLKDTVAQIEDAVSIIRRCIVVADDGAGTRLVFDNDAGEYMLAVLSGDAVESIGVRGDAVGCFLAI